MLTATRPRSVPDDQSAPTFLDRFDSALAQVPDRDAVIEGDTTLTYAELADRASRVSEGLRALGVGPGHRVVTQLPNWWETVVASWAVFLTGAVLVPVVTIYRRRELRFVIEQVDARAVITTGSYRGHDHGATARSVLAELRSQAPVVTVRAGPDTDSDGHGLPLEGLMGTAAEGPAARPAADDVAVVLYTSGTTADPKGVLHSHRTMLAEARDVAAWCGLDDDTTRVFMGSPLSHITGLSYGILLPVDLGCTTVLLDRWDADEAMRIIEAHGCTFTVSATPFLAGLTGSYAAAGTRSSLRTFVCGGADIPTQLVLRARRTMGTTVLRTYGSTELPTSTMADPTGDPSVEAAAEGAPTGGNEIAVRPDENGANELLVRGPELFLGYLDASLNVTAFDADGWFHTGDVADIDADGRLRITGRIKDIINRGGEKFSTAEVEAVLADVPGVRDVAIVGFPDPVLVERACACLVVDGVAPTLEQLRSAVVGAGLAIQKSPERVLLLDELPRTPSGKIQRYLLRERAAGTTAPVSGRNVVPIMQPRPEGRPS